MLKKIVSVASKIKKALRSPDKFADGVAQATVSTFFPSVTMAVYRKQSLSDQPMFQAGKKGLDLAAEAVRESGVPTLVSKLKKVFKKK